MIIVKFEIEIEVDESKVDRQELEERLRREAYRSIRSSESCLQPVDFPAAGRSQRDRELLDRARMEARTLTVRPKIEDVRTALSSIPGNMSDDVIAERGSF